MVSSERMPPTRMSGVSGTAWRMALLLPGNNPLQALARSLAQEGVLFRNYDAGGLTLEEIIDTTSARGSAGRQGVTGCRACL